MQIYKVYHVYVQHAISCTFFMKGKNRTMFSYRITLFRE